MYGASTQKSAPWGLARISNYQARMNSVDNADLDAYGHGTHIAGTIESKTYSVAKKTQLFAFKVLNEYTAGQTSGILAGMNLIVEDAATRKCPKDIVVNMSPSVASSPAISTAARYTVKSGYFLAVADGNDNTDASHVSPSNEPMTCPVGATA
ncbi:Cuticle-degrading protease [Fusarium agapanthi]|uniref:Cuticle-degrading protease n=1 Tax=Fusarium agapanthi TaxID=1803897 RepID=A0A9P5E472_9HYPO|nr:Cuticle-degrading protease [Fusarium agapanthi]